MADYDKFHGDYAFWMDHVNNFTLYSEIARFMPDGCQYVLDVGTGTGELIHALSHGPQHLVGLDISEQMLRHAHLIQVGEKSQSNMTFVTADALRMPFAPASLDYIVSVGVVHNIPGAEKVLLNIKTLLRPGGRIALFDLVLDKPRPPVTRWNATLRALRSFPGWLRDYNSLYVALRILRLHLNPDWIRHEQNEVMLTEGQMKEQYNAIFPGAHFQKLGELMGAFWEAPA